MGGSSLQQGSVRSDCVVTRQSKKERVYGENQLLVCEYKLKPACLAVYLRDELYCDWQMDQGPK